MRKVKELHNELFFSYTGVIVNDSGRNEIPFPIRAVRTSDFKYIRYLRNDVGHPKKKAQCFLRKNSLTSAATQANKKIGQTLPNTRSRRLF